MCILYLYTYKQIAKIDTDAIAIEETNRNGCEADLFGSPSDLINLLIF